MSSGVTKLLCTLLSTAAGGLLWYVYLETQGPGANIELVETRDDVAEIFEKRAAVAKPVAYEPEDPNVIMVGNFNYAEMEEEFARKMFPGIRKPNNRLAYDRQCFVWHVPGYSRITQPRGTYKDDVLITNNNLGFRKVADVVAEQPDLRILVTGDSHTEGVVPMASHFTEILETDLRAESRDKSIEVLNGGVGGTSLFHYLGVIEKFRYLKPDVVVVSIYGGNDFAEIRRPYRFFHRMPLEAEYSKELARKARWLRNNRLQFYAQFLHQAMTMHQLPEERELMGKAALELVDELNALCKDMGSQLVLMYIPPLYDVQPHHQTRMIEETLAKMGFTHEDLQGTNNLADEVEQHAVTSGIPFVDLREPYRAATDFLYWGSDHHINIRGNEVAADALGKAVRALGI